MLRAKSDTLRTDIIDLGMSFFLSKGVCSCVRNVAESMYVRSTGVAGKQLGWHHVATCLFHRFARDLVLLCVLVGAV